MASLARLIAKTMPEDEPGTCVGPDAEKVSAYIYDAFYSKAAQARNPMRPARIELSRLTVRQYQERRGRPGRQLPRAGELGRPRGLKGDYARGGRRRRNAAPSNDGFSRVDPEVRFHFGIGQPDPGAERRQGAGQALYPAARAAGPAQPLPPVLAGVPRELAGLGAGAGDRRVRVRRPVGERHPALGQRQQPAADRRLGEVGQRHRVSRDDLPAGRAGLSAAAGVVAGQGEDVVDRRCSGRSPGTGPSR